MSWIQNVFDKLGSEQMQTATLLGFVSIPFTIGANWILNPDVISGSPLFVICVLSGYLYNAKPVKSRDAGGQTALIGSIPILVWWTKDIAAEPVFYPNGLFLAVGISLIVLIAGFLLIFLIGMISGAIGAWLNKLVTRIRPTSTEN